MHPTTKSIGTYQSCHDDKPSILHSSVSTINMHLIDNDTRESMGNQITYYGGSICNLQIRGRELSRFFATGFAPEWFTRTGNDNFDGILVIIAQR